MIEIGRNRNAAFVFATLALMALSFFQSGVYFLPGLDSSYRYAYNYFFAIDPSAMKGVLFTYGPLGFLISPGPLGNNLYIAMTVILLLKGLLIFAAFHLHSLAKTAKFSDHSLTLFLVALIAIQISTHDLLILNVALLCLSHSYTNRKSILVLSAAIVALAFSIKFSSGMISLAVLLSYCFYNFVVSRSISSAVLAISTVFIFSALLWLIFYGDMQGAPEYLMASLEFSKGNSKAMTINPDQNWFGFAILLFSLIVFPAVSGDKKHWIVSAVMVLPLLMFFKYSFSRADTNHMLHFFNFIAWLLFVYIIFSSKYSFRLLLGVVFVASSLMFISTPKVEQKFRGTLEHKLKAAFSIQKFFTFDEFVASLAHRSRQSLRYHSPSAEIRELIGTAAVDVYPWEATYMERDRMNWKPRPVFQSYIAYTPYLDGKNAQFFASSDAPEYLLWEKRNITGSQTKSIDGRYLLNDEPLTMYTLFTHYDPVIEDDYFTVLKRDPVPNFEQPRTILSQTVTWDTWIPVPDVGTRSNVLRVKVVPQRKWWQKLKLLLYKEFSTYVVYKFTDGSQTKVRLVMDNAVNGVWVNPHYGRELNTESSKLVSKVKFLHHQADGFLPSLKIDWERWDINRPKNESRNAVSGLQTTLLTLD